MKNLSATLIALFAPLAAHCSAVPVAETVSPQSTTDSVLAQAEALPVSEPAAEVASVAQEPLAAESVAPEPSAPAPPAPEPSAQDTPQVSMGEVAARALLQRAAEFQRGQIPLSAPTGLAGRFRVQVVNPQDGLTVGAWVERVYLRAPERMLTTREDEVVNSNSTVGFDGSRTWFRDNSTQKVVVYSDDPLTFEVDLEQVRDQLRLMPVMLDAFVVDALSQKLAGLALDGPASKVSIDRYGRELRDVQWVVGRVEDELFESELGPPPSLGSPPPPAPELQVGLAIDVETGALWAFRVRTLGRSDARELELRFRFHLPSTSGLKVPAYTAVFQDGDSVPLITLNIIPDEDGGDLELDLYPEVDESMFAVPK